MPLTTESFDMKNTNSRIGLGAAGVVLGAAALVVATPLAASAHVTVSPSSTAAGSNTVLTFSVPHGCDGSATTSLAFAIPDDIPSVTPTVNPNWTIDKVMDGDRVSTVVYTAVVPLQDGYRDTVALSLRLPDDAAGETIAFPVAQTCEAGETDWSEVASAGEDPHSLEHPAPTITVTAATDEDAHGSAVSHTEDRDADTAEAGTLPIALALGAAGTVLGLAAVVMLTLVLVRASARGRAAGSNEKG